MTELLKLITVHGRELGIDLLVVSQSGFNVDPYLFDSASTIVSFGVGNNSAGVMQKAMNMTDEEARLLKKCPTGVAAVLARSISPCPMLLMLPNYAIQGVSKELRDRIMAPRLENMRQKYSSKIAEEQTSDEEEEGLNADLIHILKDYAIAPYESVSEKAVKLGYNVSTMVRHLNYLQENGLTDAVNVNLGKASGVAKLYKLTEKGIKIVGKQALVGRGSMVHGYWMHVIAAVYKAPGLRVEVEKYMEVVSGLIDVAVYDKRDEKVIAVEIALSNKYTHEVDNIKKCLKAGFQKVISAAPAEFQLKGIRKEALNRNLNLDSVEFRLLKEFYNEYTSRRRS